jgi:hypothetical protein
MQIPKREILKTKGFESDEKAHPEGEEIIPPQDPTGFEQDMETFDRMGLGNVTDKIRTDCRNRVKELNLEHLLEQ